MSQDSRNKPRPTFPEAAFADAWEGGACYADLCRDFKLTVAKITYHRSRLGLVPRRTRGRSQAAAAPVASAPITLVPVNVPRMPAHPFWTVLNDIDVLQTKGQHRAVSVLAQRLDKPAAAVLQRWHRLRVA